MKKILTTYALGLWLTVNLLVSFVGISPVYADSPTQFDGQITSLITEAREASAAGERKVLVLTLSEEDIAGKLDEIAARHKDDILVSLEDIQVHFFEDSRYLLVEAKVKYWVFKNRVSAYVLITPEGKYGYYELVAYSLGSLPGGLADWIVKRIPYEMSGPLPLGDLPVELQSVSLRDGRLYIQVITVPSG